MHLGVELGLCMPTIERICIEYPNKISKQVLGVMKEWKENSINAKPTILLLMKAMQSADGKGLSFLRKIYR
jgi:hypothetical protein